MIQLCIYFFFFFNSLPWDFHGDFKEGTATRGLLLIFSSQLSLWLTRSWWVSSLDVAVPSLKWDPNLLDFPSAWQGPTFEQSTQCCHKIRLDHGRSIISEYLAPIYYKGQTFFLSSFQASSPEASNPQVCLFGKHVFKTSRGAKHHTGCWIKWENGPWCQQYPPLPPHPFPDATWWNSSGGWAPLNHDAASNSPVLQESHLDRVDGSRINSWSPTLNSVLSGNPAVSLTPPSSPHSGISLSPLTSFIEKKETKRTEAP